MTAASELLAHPTPPLAEVPRLVGYSRGPTFARNFRRCYGVSPRAARSVLSAPRQGLGGRGALASLALGQAIGLSLCRRSQSRPAAFSFGQRALASGL